MLKRLLFVTTLGLLVTLPAIASDREDDVNRTHKAAEVLKEIMNTPDQRHSSRSSEIGEMYRHHSRGDEVCLHFRRQLR